MEKHNEKVHLVFTELSVYNLCMNFLFTMSAFLISFPISYYLTSTLIFVNSYNYFCKSDTLQLSLYQSSIIIQDKVQQYFNFYILNKTNVHIYIIVQIAQK